MFNKCFFLKKKRVWAYATTYEGQRTTCRVGMGGSLGWTQVVRLHGKYTYLLNHLTDPNKQCIHSEKQAAEWIGQTASVAHTGAARALECSDYAQSVLLGKFGLFSVWSSSQPFLSSSQEQPANPAAAHCQVCSGW